MSASTERKNRREAVAAGLDKKTKARLEEEAKARKSKMRWTIGTILVVVLIVAVLILNSSLMYSHTTAVKVGDESYTPAEMNYYIGEQYNYFATQYGSYASIFGLDTSYGVSGLASQSCAMLEDGTWLDYFAQSAVSSLQQVTALCNYADENGITLDEDEIAAIDEQLDSVATAATTYGYKNANAYLSAAYGNGVTTKVVRECMLRNQLANKAYNAYSDSLTYTDDELEEYYQSLNGASDIFEYLRYEVEAEEVTTKDADGNETTDVTDETLAAAQATAEEILAAYEEGKVPTAETVKADTAEDEQAADAAAADTADTADTAEETTDAEAAEETAAEEAADAEAAEETSAEETRLNNAIAACGIDGTCTDMTGATGSNLSVCSDFLMGDGVQKGDAAVVENSSGDGYLVIVFMDRNDNHYNTVSFRHILIETEADDDGNYTEEAKQAAYDRIMEISDEYNAGAKTEDSFAELANEYSEDEGSNTSGGLYEEVYQGEMVSAINDFLFDESTKPGDTTVVYGQTSSYEGWHMVYFVGEGELYSNVIARDAMTSNDLSDWITSLTEPYTTSNGFGYRFIG